MSVSVTLSLSLPPPPPPRVVSQAEGGGGEFPTGQRKSHIQRQTQTRVWNRKPFYLQFTWFQSSLTENHVFNVYKIFMPYSLNYD